ncbi:MAG: cytidylate kinase family protein [Suipraeoptans sp.]
MDFINNNIKTLFKRFLLASIGSALVMSVYTLVDTIAVGQYEGPIGTAATAVTSTIYGFTIFCALLCGIGGSVMMTISKARGSEKEGNSFFSLSFLIIGVLIAVSWILMAVFAEPIFTFLGARDEVTLSMVMRYAKWMVRFWPFFIYPTFISCFIRNDGAPKVATGAVILGGILNIIGDYVLVFPMDMGIEGAAIATVIGLVTQSLVMTVYLFGKKSNLKFVKVQDIRHSSSAILSIGFGAGIIELGTVIPAIVINLQISRYAPEGSALAIYGMLATITALYQALYSGVGQTVQPLASANFGAKQPERIRTILRLAMKTVVSFGFIFMLIGMLFPNLLLRLFMTDITPEILSMAPLVIRIYFAEFLFYGISVMAIYYLQSIMKDKAAIILSAMRSVVLKLALLFILPIFMGVNGIWVAITITEAVVGICAGIYIFRTKVNLDLANFEHDDFEPEIKEHHGVRIITISREFGSGGREVGKRLADSLGFAYYDNEIISAIAEQTASDEHFIERITNGSVSELKGLPITFSQTIQRMNPASGALVDLMPQQQPIIEQLATKGECIFVGRNADVLLEKYQPLKLFVYADMKAKVERCRQRAAAKESIDNRELEKNIREIDRRRVATHALVSSKPWGDKQEYRLCIDTTNISIKMMVPALVEYAKKWFS